MLNLVRQAIPPEFHDRIWEVEEVLGKRTILSASLRSNGERITGRYDVPDFEAALTQYMDPLTYNADGSIQGEAKNSRFWLHAVRLYAPSDYEKMAESRKSISTQPSAGATSTTAAPNADVSIAGDNSVGLSTRQAHEQFHAEGNFEQGIKALVSELASEFAKYGISDKPEIVQSIAIVDGKPKVITQERYKLRELAEKSPGKTITTTSGDLLRIGNDGILVIISRHFQKDHAGRSDFQALFRSKAGKQRQYMR